MSVQVKNYPAVVQNAEKMIKREDPEERSRSTAKWNLQMHWMWASKQNWIGKDHGRDEEGSAKQAGPINENEPTWNQFGKSYCL